MSNAYFSNSQARFTAIRRGFTLRIIETGEIAVDATTEQEYAEQLSAFLESRGLSSSAGEF